MEQNFLQVTRTETPKKKSKKRVCSILGNEFAKMPDVNTTKTFKVIGIIIMK